MANGLRPTMGFGDLLLFLTLTGFGVRFIATAAGAGPSAFLLWGLAGLAFYVPLVVCVLELARRYPQEGGIYVWTKQAFGEFAGFLSGWMYWVSNLVYFPGVLYFAAGNVLYLGGWQQLSNSSLYFILVSLGGLTLATLLNLWGLEVGKWLHNLGAVAGVLAVICVVLLGGVALGQFGSATPFTPTNWLPGTQLKDIIFWSSMAFALAGAESASVMGEEIKNPQKNLPVALLLAGALIIGLYLLGTLGILWALPTQEVSSLQGLMQAVERVGGRLGWTGIVPIVAGLLTLSAVGQVGAWLATMARLPFVAGVDRVLPAPFARLHPRWGTPYIALIGQGLLTAGFILLGQAGTSVRAAYDLLVSLGVLTYFLPYLFMFAALLRLGTSWPTACWAGLGFLTTAGCMGLAAVPSPAEADPLLATVKLVGLSVLVIGVGTGLYFWGKQRSTTKDLP